MVRKRLSGLGITDIHLGTLNKKDVFEDFLAAYDLQREDVLYMGDDIPDYEVMKLAGVPTCPRDAAPEIKNISIHISERDGGRGAVRDVIEQVMKAQDKWLDHDGFVW